jgi:hypothetical protein
MSEMFQIGDRVRQTEIAPRSKRDTLSGVYRDATVVGYSRDGSGIRVLIDGTKSVTMWHPVILDAAPSSSG